MYVIIMIYVTRMSRCVRIEYYENYLRIYLNRRYRWRAIMIVQHSLVQKYQKYHAIRSPKVLV